MANPFDLDQVRLFLRTSRTAALATADPDGQPHVANIQYASDDDCRLLWVSASKSEHSQHLSQRPDAAVCIYAHDDRVSNIHGLQMRGRVLAIEPDTSEWHDAFEEYTARFTFATSMPQLRSAIEKQTFYRFTPTWMRWIDNRVEFGFKTEWSTTD